MPNQSLVWQALAGRILLVSYFIAMGSSHFIHFLRHLLLLNQKRVPLPGAATTLTIDMMISGGVLVLCY